MRDRSAAESSFVRIDEFNFEASRDHCRSARDIFPDPQPRPAHGRRLASARLTRPVATPSSHAMQAAADAHRVSGGARPADSFRRRDLARGRLAPWVPRSFRPFDKVCSSARRARRQNRAGVGPATGEMSTTVRRRHENSIRAQLEMDSRCGRVCRSLCPREQGDGFEPAGCRRAGDGRVARAGHAARRSAPHAHAELGAGADRHPRGLTARFGEDPEVRERTDEAAGLRSRQHRAEDATLHRHLQGDSAAAPAARISVDGGLRVRRARPIFPRPIRVPEVRTTFSTPGPTFEAVRGQHVRVHYVNQLDGGHIFPVDPTIMAANSQQPADAGAAVQAVPPGLWICPEPDSSRHPPARRGHAVGIGRLPRIVVHDERAKKGRRSRPRRSSTSTPSSRRLSGITITRGHDAAAVAAGLAGALPAA